MSESGYANVATKWLASWGIISHQTNEENLAKIKAGKLVQIMEDDTSRKLAKCPHGTKYLRKRTWSYDVCEACNEGLRHVQTIPVYNPEQGRILYYVDSHSANIAIHDAMITLDAQRKVKEEKVAAQKAEIDAERGGRTLVYLHINYETGLVRITGGEHGYLDKPVWTQAMKELHEAPRPNTYGALLASAPAPVSRSKHFYALTKHFAYLITSHSFDDE